MAGLRDGLHRSRELYLPELEETRAAAARKQPTGARGWEPDGGPLASGASEAVEIGFPQGLRPQGDRKGHPPEAATSPASSTRSLPQRGGNIGFSVRSADDLSAWKRRFVRGSTVPPEPTARTTLLLRCALLHGLGGLLLAGVLTVFFLESRDASWLWLLLLALLLAFSGLAAYWCAGHLDRLRLARWVIVGGDLAALVYAWLLLGPSLVLVLLLPGIAALALLLAGRRELLMTACFEAAVLVALELGDLAGLPLLSLHTPAALLLALNLFGALACLGWVVYALLAVLARSEHPGPDEHRNSAEVARARIGSDIHVRQLQEGITLLQGALGRVASGDLGARVAIKEGELAALATKLNSFLDRQERMFDEARQHRRLEAAVSELVALLEALHRGERVGWPAPTGTQVDRILALMRAPLPQRPLPRITAKMLAVSADSEPGSEEKPG